MWVRRLAGNGGMGCLWEDKGGGGCCWICGGGSPALRARSFRLCRNIAVFSWIDSLTALNRTPVRPLCGRARFGFAETLLFFLGIIFVLSEIAGRLTNAARPGIRLPSAGRGFACKRNPSNPPRDVRRHITWGRQNKNARISGHFCFGVPRGIRTPVLTVKG